MNSLMSCGLSPSSEVSDLELTILRAQRPKPLVYQEPVNRGLKGCIHSFHVFFFNIYIQRRAAKISIQFVIIDLNIFNVSFFCLGSHSYKSKCQVQLQVLEYEQNTSVD